MAQQIAYPLVTGTARDVLTVTIVLTLAATAATHAAVSRGAVFAVGMVLGTAVTGFAAELLGVHTGVPFGHYDYTGSLGPRLGGVPLVIGLAWTMLAWPAVTVAQAVVTSVPARVAVTAWALAGTDLFLDPQLVDAGYWRWRDPTPHLPGVHAVPLTNTAGWIAVSVVLAAVLVAVTPPRPPRTDLLPRSVFVWLYVGWIVALAVFGDQAAAAGWGALALAPVVAGVLTGAAAPLRRRAVTV